VNIPDGCFYYALPGTCFQWLEINSVGGSGNVSFFFTPNSSCSSRSCSIWVTNGNSTEVASFSVTQAGAGAMPQPSPINGQTEFCTSTQSQFSITPVASATSYMWSFTGLGVLSGTGTSISFAPPGSGTLSVAGVNSCGNSSTRTLAISFLAPPDAPSVIQNTELVCGGTQHTFSVPPVSGATSYTWSYSGTLITDTGSNTLDYSPIESGTLEVFASNTCGAGPATTAAVALNWSPDGPASIDGAIAVCTNVEVNYEVNEVLGATGYEWILPPNWTGSSESASITVVTSAAGAIQVAAFNACGTSAYITLDIVLASPTAEPGPITGPTEVCPNGTALYSVDEVLNVISYQWLTPDDWSGTSDSASIQLSSITASGIVQVLTFDGCVWSTPQSLVISTTPTLEMPSPVTGPQQPCVGGVVIYSVNEDPSVDQYEWSLPDASWSGTSDTASISLTVGSSSGLIRVRGVDQCGPGAQRTRSLTTRAIPEALPYINGETTVCVGEQTNYTTLANSAVDYFWEMTGASVPSVETGASMVTVTWVQPGEHTLTAAATNVCGSGPATQITVTVEDCTSINELLANGSLRLYPNPSDEYVALEWAEAIEIRHIEVCDASGRAVRSIQNTSGKWPANASLIIELQTVEAGLYFVRVTTNNGGYVLPLVKR